MALIISFNEDWTQTIGVVEIQMAALFVLHIDVWW